MKKLLKSLAFVATFAIIGSPAYAQSVGDLVKKGRNVAEKLSKERKVSPAAVAMSENGITVQNPMASYIGIEPVGLYGVSGSGDTGNVYLVLKVEMKMSAESALFGSSIQNKKMIAVDPAGKTYGIDSSGAFRYDTPEGVAVEVRLDNPGLMFENVPRSVERMQMVKFGVGIDATHQGNITLKNVPITWDDAGEQP